jgi:CHAD domain-containing protein
VRDHHRAELGWLSDLTGPARDLDVLLLEWERYVAPLDAASVEALAPVRDELERRRTLAHEELSAGLRSERYEDLMAGWERWLRTPSDDASGPSVGTVVARRIEAAQRRVLEAGRAITAASPAEALHDLRKDAKRLRYLLECFGSLLPGKRRKPFVAALKGLQDNLGAHQDAEVHGALLRDLVDALRPEVGPDAVLAMGQLIERLDRRRTAERAAFSARFAAYDTRATARALDRLLDGLRG